MIIDKYSQQSNIVSTGMIPKPLLEDIKNKQCLPFIGAGFSLNAKMPKGKHMPDWKEISQQLLVDKNSSQTDPLDIAQEFEDKFGRVKLVEQIENGIFVKEAKPGNVHKLLAKIESFDLIYTTNFDMLLENTFLEASKPVKSIASPKQIGGFAGGGTTNIIKLHGDVQHSENMIITKNDYKNFFSNHKSFGIHLAGALMTKTPLFIGYGLRDPNVLHITDMVKNILKKSTRKGYIVLFNCTNEDIAYYEQLNLNVINLESETKTNEELLLCFLQEIYGYESSDAHEDKLDVKINKKIFAYGEILSITGKTRLNQKDVFIKIVDSGGAEVYQKTLDLDLKPFDIEITLSDLPWKIHNKYTIKIESGEDTRQHEFYITKYNEIMVQTDKSVYLPNDDVILSIINQNKIQNIPMNVEITGPKGLVYRKSMPIELDDNNGIYQELILTSGTNWSSDQEAEYKITAEYGGLVHSSIIYVHRLGAIVELDQKIYTWTDKVDITVIAPESATDTDSINKIFVTISTRLGKLENYVLVESGIGTGVFTGKVSLTGFLHKLQQHTETRQNIGTTAGNGPVDGILAADHEDVLSVSFNYSEDETTVGSAIIRWNVGEIQWLRSSYKPNDMATVRVIDPDMNLNSDKIDSFMIKVWSDSDPTPIPIEVVETNTNSGIFEGIVAFGKDDGTAPKVITGDNVHAKYTDETLPDPYIKNDKLDVTATVQITSSPLLPALKKFDIQNIAVYGTDKNTEHINAGAIKISLDVTNNQEWDQSCVVLVQIRDENAVVLDVIEHPDKIKSKQTKNIEIPYEIKTAGKYNIEFFIWESTTTPQALTQPKKIGLIITDHKSTNT